MYDYDLFVIGAGSGGVRLARTAAALGAKVAIAEDRYMGGTCVNVGCVPKKLYVYASHVEEDLNEGKGFGWQHDGNLSFDLARLLEQKNQEIRRLNGIYKNLLTGSDVTVFENHAKLIDSHTVDLGSHKVSARHITIATGSWPSKPDIPGADLAITSNEFFTLNKLPKTATVLGGGYIAVELAGILNGLGVETTLVYRGELFLRGFDEDIRLFVKEEISKKGIHLKFLSNIVKLENNTNGSIDVHLNSGESYQQDLVIVATGRTANTQNLGLENVGITPEQGGAIPVDSNFQTTCESIYAIGDVMGGPQLTPVALKQAMVLAQRLFGKGQLQMDYDFIPTAVFCQPNIATVGLTESDAQHRYNDIEVYRSEFRALKHTLSGSSERTLMKLIVDKYSRKVLGAHMVGAEAGEIIQGVAVAIKAGATKDDFDNTIGIHPTAAEEFVTMRTPV